MSEAVANSSKRLQSLPPRRAIPRRITRPSLTSQELNNNTAEGTNRQEEKKVEETKNGMAKGLGNESTFQIQKLKNKSFPVPSQYWKYQYRPSTAPPSLTEDKNEPPTLHNEEVIDFLKGSDSSSPSYQDVRPSSGGVNSTHQPNELVTPSLTSCMKGQHTNKAVLKKSKPKPTGGMAKFKPACLETNIVTFSPETVNIERENKPKRARSQRNNRKPKFAHPCCGHFLPPTDEIITLDGPVEDSTNSYTKYTQVWTHPSHRTSPETNLKWNIRKTRFDKLLQEVSQIHRAFNTFSDDMKTKCLKKEIIPRYVMALDIVLTDGDTKHVDSLAKTVESSVRVLQTILHNEYFDEDGIAKEMSPVPPEGPGYLQDLGSIISALNKISSNRPRQETNFLGIEPAFAKLQFELLSLSFCPTETILFRCLISVIPFTLRRIKKLLQDAADKDDSVFYIKWINNSVMHRDYMAIMKDFGFADENGAKDELPNTNRKAKIRESLRPFSADADLRRPSEKN